MQYTQKWKFSLLLGLIGSMLYVSTVQAETLPPLDATGQRMLHDRTLPFFAVFDSFETGYAYNEGRFVYLKKIFNDRWEDLFTSEFAYCTQNEPDKISRNEAEVYARVRIMVEKTAIMRLFCNAALKWALRGTQQRNAMLNEAILGQYLANMPSALKKTLLLVREKHIFLGQESQADAYFDRSRYAFYAMIANTMLLHDQCDLFMHFDEICEDLKNNFSYISKQERSEKITLIEQIQDLLYEALGEGQRHKIALYFDLKQKCDQLEYCILEKRKLHAKYKPRSLYSDDTSQFGDDSGSNVSDEMSFPEVEKLPFVSTTRGQTLERECMGEQVVPMSYRMILDTLCPDVKKELQHNNQLCASLLAANKQCSSRGTSLTLESDSGPFSISRNSQEYAVLECILDAKVGVTFGMQAALAAPHLHETPLSAKELQQKWPQEIDRISRLEKQYPDNRLVVAHAAKKAQAIALQVLCNTEHVPNDIETLISKFMFPQWGLYVKPYPGKPDSVAITSDGIRDLLSDQDEALSAQKKIPAFERMRPSDVFRLFSSHYDPSGKRAAIVVPKDEVTGKL